MGDQLLEGAVGEPVTPPAVRVADGDGVYPPPRPQVDPGLLSRVAGKVLARESIEGDIEDRRLGGDGTTDPVPALPSRLDHSCLSGTLNQSDWNDRRLAGLELAALVVDPGSSSGRRSPRCARSAAA